MIEIRSWPTAAVMIATVLALAALVLAGPALGVSAETMRLILGGVGSAGAVLLAAMRGLYHEA